MISSSSMKSRMTSRGVMWEAARSAPSGDLFRFLCECDKVTALDLDKVEPAREEPAEPEVDPALRAEILEMIEKRAAAKKEKNFAEADRIRDALAAKGIRLIDTPKGTTFGLIG